MNPMNRWVGWLALLVGCNASSADPVAPPPDGGVNNDAGQDGGSAEMLAPGLFTIDGTEPDRPNVDLQALDASFARAQVVGIGESVHTTGGQYRMRIRLLRHLIESQGLRVIAFESNPQDVTQVMGGYLERCEGSPELAAKSLNPIWWDVSVPPFLAWLCRWNQAHPSERVDVLGFDIRQPWYDSPAYRVYAVARDASAGAGLADGLARCLGVGFRDEASFFADPAVRSYYAGSPTPEPDHTACQAGVEAALADLSTKRSTYVANAGEEAWDFARLAVRRMGAFDDSLFYLSRDPSLSGLAPANQARDPAMYDTLQTLRKYRFPNRKTAVWAHNGHVIRDARSLTNSQWSGVVSLGTSLGDEYGAGYVVVAQVSLQTKTAFQGKVASLPTPAPTSVERLLEPYGRDFLLLLLPEGTEGASPAVRGGLVKMGTDPWTLVLSKHADAIVWHRRSDEATYFATP